MPRYSLLIMDRSESSLPRVSQAARPFGCGILWAESLEDGLSLLSQSQPDLVLASESLLGQEGLQKILEAITLLKLPTQLILMTDSPDFDRAMEAISLGAFSVLATPISPDKLRQALARIFEQSSLFRVITEKIALVKNRDSLDVYKSLAGRLEAAPLAEALASLAVSAGQIDRAEVSLSDSAFSHPVAASSGIGRPGSAQSILELSWKGQALGTLKLFFRSDRSGLDQDFIDELAWAGSMYLEQCRKYQEAVRLASRDALTGLFNRRVFFETLEREHYQAQRHNSPLSLIALDLDRFKSVNDTFGHQTGDLLLKWLSDTLAGVVRAGDLLARVGGEEFSIILPRTDMEQAKNLSLRIKEALSSNPLPKGLSMLRPTVSQGISGLQHFMINSSEDLIYWADQAMYLAKKEGRDTVRMVTDLPGKSKLEDTQYVFQ